MYTEAVLCLILSLGPSVFGLGRECVSSALISTTFRDGSGRMRMLRDEAGKFAIPGSRRFLSGWLVHVKLGYDDTGCLISSWRQSPKQTGPWIALIRRGGCSLQVKIENALQTNASGVFIHNYRPAPNLNKMRLSRAYKSRLEVVFIHKWKGDEIAALLDGGTQVMAYASVSNPCVEVNIEPDTSIEALVAVFLVFIIVLLTLVWLILFYIYKYNDSREPHYINPDEKALSRIPTKTLKTSDEAVQDDTECCPICIDPYQPSDVIRILICHHEFHKECIDPWLLQKRTCPMCKTDILRQYGSVYMGSQESIIQVMGDEDVGVAIEELELDLPESETRSNRSQSPDSGDMEILTCNEAPISRTPEIRPQVSLEEH